MTKVVIDICFGWFMKNLDKVCGNGKKQLENDVGILLDALERHG